MGKLPDSPMKKAHSTQLQLHYAAARISNIDEALHLSNRVWVRNTGKKNCRNCYAGERKRASNYLIFRRWKPQSLSWTGFPHASTNSPCFFGAKFNLLIMPITSAHTYVFLYQRELLSELKRLLPLLLVFMLLRTFIFLIFKHLFLEGCSAESRDDTKLGGPTDCLKGSKVGQGEGGVAIWWPVTGYEEMKIYLNKTWFEEHFCKLTIK